ncbi:unnamed protein product [Coffea canephora]|uniref:Uncharacterized protein n=1 Tax=Coffea canephora TaxID=49390 RepID=A0A068UBU0_COFCA|nr:unnamed protein product [Coffea canephora]
MELDRPHHRTTPGTASTSSELFVCFTSRLSASSSMKIAKSILSPGRARDPPISLPTSLSRRLRTNGSIKGGQASPMFPTGGKKRGCAFENPEPSSPKVTCIGQVRVKTKKKVKQTRSLSRRRSAGEASFRKVEQLSNDDLKISGEELGACNRTQQQQRYAPPANSSSHFQQQECLPQRNQRWVHLPVTICEGLRAFGAEFSCLFPCRSSCFSTNDREKEEKAGNIGQGGHGEEGNNGNDNSGQSSCGAVFARWFVALQDCEGGKSREIELVVGGGDEEVGTEARERTSMRSSRRHVFEDIEFKEEMIAVKGEEEEEKARVSICVPPKNALLLMRCRSDPMKVATLANRFWESPAPKDDENEAEEENGEGNGELVEVPAQDLEIVNEEAKIEVEVRDEVVEQLVSAESNEEAEEELEKEAILANDMQEFVQEDVEDEKPGKHSSKGLEVSKGKMQILIVSEEADEEEEVETGLHSFEDDLLDEEMAENMQRNLIQGQAVEEEKEEQSMPISRDSLSSEESSDRQEEGSEGEALKKEATVEFLPVEEADLEEENEAKTDESNIEDGAEIPHETSTSLEEQETDNDETKQLTTTFLLSEADDGENASESEKVEQIEAADGQESQEPPQEENDEDVEVDKNDETKGTTIETETIQEDEEKENSSSSSNALPECLLLMMCEPKLSMEVSKETWVCSTDFVRWLPERRPAAAVTNKKLVNAPQDPKKEVSCANSNNPPPPPMGPQPHPPPQELMSQEQEQQQAEIFLPPRSSCSLPAAAAVSMAAMIEQKLVNAGGYEPFVLTRCKSEPMRTAAAKLMPEACFWKNRKLEPHRSATFGVGAAGVGF